MRQRRRRAGAYACYQKGRVRNSSLRLPRYGHRERVRNPSKHDWTHTLTGRRSVDAPRERSTRITRRFAVLYQARDCFPNQARRPTGADSIEFLPLQKLWRPRCIKFYDFRPGFLSLPYFSSVPIYVVEGIRNSIACKKGHRA